MSTHGINMDAIQAGVEAFLQTYPDEAALDARSPTAAPKGAHAVLWIDDWWRGVDMARETLLAADLRGDSPSFGSSQVSVGVLRQVACTAARSALSYRGELPDTSDMADPAIDRDAVAVFCAEICALVVVGVADMDGAKAPVGLDSQAGRWQLPACDPEVMADLAEPA